MDEIEEKLHGMETISKKKARWIGHILRHDGLQKTIIGAMIAGKRGRRKRRTEMMDDLRGKRSYSNIKKSGSGLTRARACVCNIGLRIEI